jgi:hypothetical protein
MTIQNPDLNFSQNVLGDLTTEEVAEVNQLLIVHPELIEEVDRLQEVLSLLPLALPETYPSGQLRSQVLTNAFQQTTQVNPDLQPQSYRKPLYKKSFFAYLRKSYSIGVIMAALLIGIGFDSYKTKQQLAIAQSELSGYQQAIAQLKQPYNKLLALRGMGDLPTASGSLVIATQKNSAFLTIQNLSLPPQNMSYCLWALVDGKKTYISDFMPDRTGTVMINVAIAPTLMGAKSVVITLESKESTPKPSAPVGTGEMVMQGELSL